MNIDELSLPAEVTAAYHGQTQFPVVLGQFNNRGLMNEAVGDPK